jgi:Ca2+-binding RTX toxin-like protein
VVEQANEGNDTVQTALAFYSLEGHANVENLTGLSNAGQVLVGNDADNAITGGLGADTLVGLGGADVFTFTTALGGGNVDTISDFVSGVDKIALDDAVFDSLAHGALPASAFHVGNAATDEDQRILYDQTNGNLYYDADGSGGGAAVLFATLHGAPALTASDFQVI